MRNALISALVKQLQNAHTNATPDAEAAQRALPPAHLLAILLSDTPANVQPAADAGTCGACVTHVAMSQRESGLADVTLTMLESWLRLTSSNPTAPLPLWADASLLLLHTLGMARPAPAPEASDGPQSAEDKLQRLVSSMWSSGGLLSAEQQQRALDVCLRLLPHLHAWAESWSPSKPPSTVLSTPDNAAFAVVQLLACLTMQHDKALHVLHSQGLQRVLSLPGAALSPRLERPLMALARRVLEDPVTLQV